jgi:hypothetical protein
MPTETSTIRVFDDILRTDTSPAAYAASEFGYLNRSARPAAQRVRAVIEEWFIRYPVAHADELHARPRTDDQHQAAFFELFVHEMLTRSSWAVEVHPELPGTTRRPDFRATRGDQHVLVEAATVMESGIVQAASARRAMLLDALNRLIESPSFFVNIYPKREGPSSLSARQVASQVTTWLRRLDPDQVAIEYVRSPRPRSMLEIARDGWSIDFVAIPKKPEARGRLGVRPIGGLMAGGYIDTRTPLRDAIRMKATAYGKLDAAFVIAVNVATQFDADEISVMEALFGRETFTFGPAGIDDMRRQANGSWIGPKGPCNTRNSAVLVVNRFGPWKLAGAFAKVYRNPYAPIACPIDVLPFPCAVTHGDEMASGEGILVRDLLSLPESWPRDGA